jgi:hypothetical protein
MAKRRRIFHATFALALAVGALAAASAAADVTLGQVYQGVSSPGNCPITGDGFVLESTDTLNPYTVPAGGGEITQWSTSWGTSGNIVTLVVMRRVGLGDEAVAWDSETFPSATTSHVATFTLATPIPVLGGDSVGLYALQNGSVPCEFATGVGSSLQFIPAALGQGTPFADGSLITPENDELPNVEAVVTQSADLALSAPASLAAVNVGAVVDFSVSATTSGASEAATVTDTLSSGLTPLAAYVGTTACTVAGQIVTCPVASEPATISVVAEAASAGSASNSATIAGSLTDPGAANNAAATSVTISAAAAAGSAGSASAPATGTCKLAPLGGIRLALAQTIVVDLGCATGAVKKHSSKTVPKGEVIATTPAGPASLRAGTAVSFTVSSGKPPKPKHSKAKPKG